MRVLCLGATLTRFVLVPSLLWAVLPIAGAVALDYAPEEEAVVNAILLATQGNPAPQATITENHLALGAHIGQRSSGTIYTIGGALGGALIGGLMALLGTVITKRIESRRDDFEILRSKLESINDLLDEYQDWIGLYQSHVCGVGKPYRSSPINKLIFLMRLYFPSVSGSLHNLQHTHKAYEDMYFQTLAAKVNLSEEGSKDEFSDFFRSRDSLNEATEKLRTDIIDEGMKLLTKIHAN